MGWPLQSDKMNLPSLSSHSPGSSHSSTPAHSAHSSPGSTPLHSAHSSPGSTPMHSAHSSPGSTPMHSARPSFDGGSGHGGRPAGRPPGGARPHASSVNGESHHGSTASLSSVNQGGGGGGGGGSVHPSNKGRLSSATSASSVPSVKSKPLRRPVYGSEEWQRAKQKKTDEAQLKNQQDQLAHNQRNNKM